MSCLDSFQGGDGGMNELCPYQFSGGLAVVIEGRERHR